MSFPYSRAIRRTLVPGLATITFASACADTPASPAIDRSALTSAMTVADAQAVTGEIGPGALYGLYLPGDWNGDLVLYTHGYAPVVWPLALPDADPVYAVFRDALLDLGFGLAWSSYSENGMAIQDGAIRTRQLQALFTDHFARPQHTYLWGYSQGAVVALKLAQLNPQLFDGVLSECGVTAGMTYQLNHFFNVRVLFDYFYPDVIPGTAIAFPEGVDFVTDVQPSVIAAIMAKPAAALELAAIDQVRMEYASFSELVQSIVVALGRNTAWWFAGEVYERTHGQPFFDNSDVSYSGSSDDPALNAGVARFTAHPSAVNEIAHWYAPSGLLDMPVLTLHTRRDPVVPVRHEAAFAALVNAAGASDRLVQRIPDRFGHCAFTLPEKLAAINDLATWVRTSARPGS